MNAPESRSFGLEVEAPTGNPAIDGNRFGRDPSFTGSVGAVWTPLSGLSVNGRVSYVSACYSDVNNLSAERVGDCVLVDAGVSSCSWTRPTEPGRSWWRRG